MIDAGLYTCISQSLVLHPGETLTPIFHLAGLAFVQLAGLLAETIGRQTTGAAQDMGVMITAVPSLPRCMNSHVSGAAMTLHNLAGKIYRQAFTLIS